MTWQHLTESERTARRDCLRAWLVRPQRDETPHAIAALQDLAIDRLVREAYMTFATRDDIHRARLAQASWAKMFRDALCTHLTSMSQSSEDVVDIAIGGVLRRLFKPTGYSGTPDTLDMLIREGADQLAAALVFRHIRDFSQDDIVCGVLLPHVARLLIRLCTKSRPVEDQVERGIEAILAEAVRFQYQGLGQAVNYFKAIYVQRVVKSTRGESHRVAWIQMSDTLEDLLYQQDASPLLRVRKEHGVWKPLPLTLAPESSLPPFDTLVTRLGRKSAIRYWFLCRLKSMCVEEREATWTEVTAWLREDRQLTWPEIVARLYDDNQLTWPEIVNSVPEPQDGLFDDVDLPPGISWREVRQAFQDVKLTEEALKTFYSRCKRTLKGMERQRVWDILSAILGREGTIRYWIMDRLYERLVTVQEKPSVKVDTLVLQDHCGILSDEDLPPEVSWEGVRQAFNAQYQRPALTGVASGDREGEQQGATLVSLSDPLPKCPLSTAALWAEYYDSQQQIQAYRRDRHQG